MYILLCANGEYYTGSTNDLERRMIQHHHGEGANFTWKHMPVELIYSEEHPIVQQAFHREKQIQKWGIKKKEAIIKGDPYRLKALSRNHTEFLNGIKRVPKMRRN